MAFETRTQLKTYFQTGDKPTQAQFINLIDSAVPFAKTITFADSPYTVLDTDYTIFGDCIGGEINTSIPLAASFPGRILCFKKLDASGDKVVLNASGGNFIETAAPYEMNVQFQSVIIQSNGINDWWVIGKV